MLFNDRLAPITYSSGFLEAAFDEVVRADQDWLHSLGTYRWKSVSGSFEHLLRMLDPLSAPRSKSIWVSTRSKWTAYFDNSINGSDPFSPISFLAKKLKCRGVLVTVQPDTSFVFGARRIEIYGPEQTEWLNLVRAVYGINDGGRWIWHTSGEIQSFEDTAHYKTRKIKDRLTPDMIKRYCHTLGIELFEESFFGKEGVIVENDGLIGNVRVEAIEEVRFKLGLNGNK